MGSSADAGITRGRGWNVEVLSFICPQREPSVLSSPIRDNEEKSYTCLWRKSRAHYFWQRTKLIASFGGFTAPSPLFLLPSHEGKVISYHWDSINSVITVVTKRLATVN